MDKRFDDQHVEIAAEAVNERKMAMLPTMFGCLASMISARAANAAGLLTPPF